ncbi:MAG: DUF4974 domain-containing protein [Bacteroidia bacterium]|nr:DUF4974 domain-containing protein [Bacteroidia bacterium]
MTEYNEEDLRFVASKYDREKYDTKRAIARFNETTAPVTPRRRWWTTAAAVAASAAIAFAAGVGIVSTVKDRPSKAQPQEITVHNPNVAVTHEFIYDDAPLAEVLAELSAYYHCTLTTKRTDKHLTATFPDDDIDFIVSLIEDALGITITIER